MRKSPKRTWLVFWRQQLAKLDSLQDAPPWLVSMIAHIALLLILALITISSPSASSLLLTFRQGNSPAMNELAEFALDPVKLDTSEIVDVSLPEAWREVNQLDVPLQLTEMTFNANSVPSLPGIGATAELAAASTSRMTNMFSGRSGLMKLELLKTGGGTAETEQAVALGLAWLKRQQQADGSWSLRGPYANGARDENATAATAMAMLAFMGAGTTHKTGKYKPEVLRAARWLVNQQDSKGFMAANAREHEKMYAQAQASIVLCELFAMTGDYWIKPYAQRACDFACAAQSAEGGWRYVPRFDSDTSVSGWFVMALKSGHAAGLEISSSVFPRVEGYLDRVGGEYDAGYAYRIGERPSPSMTAEGLLCRQYLGWHRNMPGMARGLGALVANHPLDTRRPDVYYWYYATQTLHHYGGPLWEEWNERLRTDVPDLQVKQGAERGSWSPIQDAWGRHAGRLYTTCLSLYCLEVYYRHMPIYEPPEAVAVAQEGVRGKG